MESLLSSLVNRLLARFVVSAGGESGSSLRATLGSTGVLVLRHLELNLDPLLGSLPVRVQRAYARELQVSISWSQQIEVTLDTVEVVLALKPDEVALDADELQALAQGIAEAATESATEQDFVPWWLGTFRSSLLLTLFNIRVNINNVVVKFLTPESVATLACDHIRLYTAPSLLSSSANSVPQGGMNGAWLWKTVEIQKLTLSLDASHDGESVRTGAEPLLCSPKIEVTALLPVQNLLDGRPFVGNSPIEAHVNLSRLDSCVNGQQLDWLRTFTAKFISTFVQVRGAGVHNADEILADSKRGLEREVNDNEELPAEADNLSAFTRAMDDFLNGGGDEDEPEVAEEPCGPLAISLSIYIEGGRLALAQNGRDTLQGDSAGVSQPVRLSRSTAHSTELYHLEGESELGMVVGPAHTLLAVLEWEGLRAEADLVEKALVSADLKLRQFSLSRSTLIGKADDQGVAGMDVVLGLYPANTDGTGAPAIFAHWERPQPRGPELTIKAADLASHKFNQPTVKCPAVNSGLLLLSTISLRLGQVFAVWVPGLAGRLINAMSKEPPLPLAAASAANEVTAQAGKGADIDVEAPPERGMQPVTDPNPGFSGGLSAQLAITSLQLAVLSAEDPAAEAVILSTGKVSGSWGPIKPVTVAVGPPGREGSHGSVTADLMHLAGDAAPLYGARMTFLKIALSIAERWIPANSRAGTDGAGIAGAHRVSSGTELQLLFSSSGCPSCPLPPTSNPPEIITTSHGNSQATPDTSKAGGKLFCGATNALSVTLSAAEVTAVLAVVAGVSAGASQGWLAPLKPRSATLPGVGNSLQPWLSEVVLEVAALRVRHCTGSINSSDHPLLSIIDAHAAISARSIATNSLGPAVISMVLHEISLSVSPTAKIVCPIAQVTCYRTDADGAPHEVGKILGLTLTSGVSCTPDEGTSFSSTRERGIDIQSCSLKLSAASLAIVAEFIHSATSGRAAIPPMALQYPVERPAATSLASSTTGIGSGADCRVEVESRIRAKLWQLNIAVDVGSRSAALGVAITAAGLKLDSFNRLMQDPSRGAVCSGTSQVSVSQFQLSTLEGRQGSNNTSWSLRPVPRTEGLAACTAIQLVHTSRQEGDAPGLSDWSVESEPLEACISPATATALRAVQSVWSASSAGSSAEAISGDIPVRGAFGIRAAIKALRVTLVQSSEVCSQLTASELPGSSTCLAATLRTGDLTLIWRDMQATQTGILTADTAARMRHLNASSALFRLELSGPSLPASLSTIVGPSPLRMEFVLNGAAHASTCYVNADYLPLRISRGVLDSAEELLRAVYGEQKVTSSSSGEEISASAGCKSSHLKLKDDVLGCDLRCGLFSRSPHPWSEPGALEVSMGDQAANSTSWIGAGEIWIAWHYPHARPVQRLVLLAVSEELCAADFELWCRDTTTSELVGIPLQRHVTDTGMILVPKTASPDAKLWQLSWNSSNGCSERGCSAKEVLEQLRVNPSQLLNDPSAAPADDSASVLSALPLLPVPWATAFSAAQVELTLMASASVLLNDEPFLRETAVIQLIKPQVSYHSWTSGERVIQHRGEVSVSYFDSGQLITQQLLHMPSVHVHIQRCPFPGSTIDFDEFVSSESPPIDSAPLHSCIVSSKDADLLLPVARPKEPGTCIAIRASAGPLSVRLSELGAPELSRTITELTSFVSGPVKSETSPQAGDVGTHPALPPRSGGSAVTISNQCKFDVSVCQCGIDELVTIPAGAERTYQWRASPALWGPASRELQICVLPPALSTPVNTEAVTSWSSPVDILTEGGTHIVVKCGAGLSAALAVRVERSQGSSRVVLLPGFCIRNRMGQNVHVCHAGLRRKEDLALEPAHGFDKILIPEQQGAGGITLMGYYPSCTADMYPELRVWLGGGDGWSLPVQLRSDTIKPLEISTRAGGFGVDAPASPISAAARDTLRGTVICHMSIPNPVSGQIMVTLRPLYELRNLMPCSVQMCLSQASADMATEQCITIPTGKSAALQSRREGSETLTLRRHHGIAGSGDGAIWCSPLAITPVSTRKSWHLLPQASSCFIPTAGQLQALELPPLHGGDGGLSVVLACMPAEEGSSVSVLTLLPYAVLHNCTPLDLSILVQGGRTFEAPASQSTAFDWQRLRSRPKAVSLAMAAPAGYLSPREQSSCVEPTQLQSQMISLEGGTEQQLCFVCAARSDDALGQVLLACQVENRAAQGSNNSSISVGHETVHITVTPALFVSNLTSLPLQLHLHGALTGPYTLPCPSGSNVSLLQAFGVRLVKTSGAPSVKPHRPSTEGQTLLPHTQPVPSAQPAAVHTACGVSVTIAGAKCKVNSEVNELVPFAISVMHSTARERLEIREEGCAISTLLTYRVISGHGRQHLVLFQDKQPPFRIQNATPSAVEVGIFLPEPDGSGGSDYMGPVATTIVSAESSRETAMEPPCGLLDDESMTRSGSLHGDGEDEEAFMECLMSRQLPQSGQLPAILKLRPVGDAVSEWSAPVMLLPGSHAAGTWEVTVSQACATTAVLIKGQRQSAVVNADDVSAGHTPLVNPLSVKVSVEELQVSLWDDERHRFTSSQASQPKSSEIFCCTVRSAVFTAKRWQQSGLGSHRVLEGNLAAAGMQLDSFLPGSQHPVVCAMQPPRWHPGPQAPTAPRLRLTLQVHTALCEGKLPAAGFSNTWIKHVEVVLPPLAIALDDITVAFVEQLQTLLGSKASSTTARSLGQEGGQQETHTPCVDACTVTLEQLVSQLMMEAVTVASSRLLLERLDISGIQLLFDLHLSQQIGSSIPLDTHAAPLGLAPVSVCCVLFRPTVLAHGLLAHFVAEALLSAPQMLGSLELLLNPTGLLRSAAQGFQDLVAFPLAALEARSPLQFITGLGFGSASLVRNLSGWTLTSIAGFSGVFARVLDRSIAIRFASGAITTNQPLTATGYYGGAGIWRGLGKGLAGVVGLPVSGALGFVSLLSTGLARATGATVVYHPVRTSQTDEALQRRSSICHLIRAAERHMSGLTIPCYVAHCEVLSAILVRGIRGGACDRGRAAISLSVPVLLLTQQNLLVMDGGGVFEIERFPLTGLAVKEDHSHHKLFISFSSSLCGFDPQELTVVLSQQKWSTWLPVFLHRRLEANQCSSCCE